MFPKLRICCFLEAMMGYIEDLRKIVGNQPLILVGVAVTVLNEKGQILLQKRQDGVWGVPGGFIELGESTKEAGRREVFEETGIEVGKLDLIGVFSGKQHFVKLPNGDEFYPVTVAYVTKDIKGGNLKADGKETIEANFFKPNELPVGLSPFIGTMIKQYFNSFEKQV
jgi:ADP-ribose pyrophosphatase YjhB (NUDIX family)